MAGKKLSFEQSMALVTSSVRVMPFKTQSMVLLFSS